MMAILLGLAMSFSVLAITVSAATLAVGVIVEAAWQQRRERAERRSFEESLTAAERQRWRNFETAGGAWHEFADLLNAERGRDAGFPRQ